MKRLKVLTRRAGGNLRHIPRKYDPSTVRQLLLQLKSRPKSLGKTAEITSKYRRNTPPGVSAALPD
jgi:hypothetical protein